MISIKESIRQTFQLAYPVIIGQLGIIMMGVVDSLMVGGLGAVPLAAASLANSLFFLIIIIGLGVSNVVTPLVAISVGANQWEQCGIYFRQSLLVNFFIGTILMIAIYFVADIIKYFHQPEGVIFYARSYMKILSFSVLPLMLFQTYKQFIEGLSFTKPAMVVTLLANIVNIFGNWVFIFGKLGMPKLGLDGAGLSTLFCRAFMGFAMMYYVMKSSEFSSYNVNFHFKNINIPVIKKILNLGLPSGFQYFFEIGAFSFAIIMIGWLGAKQLAAHQIAINLASISYMAVLGISTAGGIRVGNAVGRQNTAEIRRAGFVALLSGSFIMIVSGIIFITMRNILPALYISDEKVVQIASSLLIIAALFQLSDGTQAVGLGILRGLTDVKIPTFITFISYWLIGLPIGYFLGFKFDYGVQGIWVGLLLGLTSSAILLTYRFNVKSKQRIAI